ncbi:MAG: serine hydrolase [Cyanobacteria bacterium P01_H01_bin.105]
MGRRFQIIQCIAPLIGVAVGVTWSTDAIAQIVSSDLTPFQLLHPQNISMIAIAPPSDINPSLSNTALETTLTVEKIAEIDAYLAAHEQTGRLSGGLMIAYGDEPTFIRNYGLANREHSVANTPETKFRIGSITKQFTAVAILQLQEQGLLDVQAPISDYLPDYPGGNRITSHHLLTHTSGIPEYLDGEIFPDILEWMRLSFTLEQLIDRFKDLPLEFDPGEHFKYSNSGYVLLTQIIETISEQSYADYMQTNVFTPLGMINTGYEIPKAVIPNLAQGYLFIGDDLYLQTEPIDMSLPQGAGGLYSTLQDLARWNHWLYGTIPAAQPILSETSIELLTTAAVQMDTPEDYPDTFYGYGLVSDSHLDRKRIHHNGGINGFRSSLMHYPEENLTISVLLNLNSQSPEPIAEGLAAILFDEPYTTPQQRKAIDLDPALYEKYVGTYQVLPELQVKLWVENNQLMSQATGQDSFVLYPSSETEFFARIVDIVVRFKLNDDGTVAGFVLYQLEQELFAPKLTE